MAVDVLTEILIQRPRAEVASYAANPDNATAWYANIESVEWRTEPPLQVGSLVALRARFLGRQLEYTYRITDLVPGRRLVMGTADGPFAMETTYEWSDDGLGTQMTLRNAGTPTGFGSVLGPAMAAAMRRANQKDLARLKRLLESRNPELVRLARRLSIRTGRAMPAMPGAHRLRRSAPSFRRAPPAPDPRGSSRSPCRRSL